MPSGPVVRRTNLRARMLRPLAGNSSMVTRSLTICAVLVGLRPVLPQARADIVFANEITGPQPGLSAAFTAGQFVAPHLSVTGLSHGPGVAGTTGADRYVANSWNTHILDESAYFSWTVDADPGYALSLRTFHFSGERSLPVINEFALRSSLDGFTNNIGSPTATPAGATVYLLAAQFRNLPQAVEFRLYAWGADSATNTLSVNDFSFEGTITLLPPAGVEAVPEAAGWKLGAIVAAFAATVVAWRAH